MQEKIKKAFAKVNLTLDVTGKREDGYHTVRMVMQTISLHDDVTVRLGGRAGLRMSSNIPYLPNDERNLAIRAAKLFYKETGIQNPGTEIQIHKRIPIAAGLAGGSTDAAAVLKLLDEMHGTGLSVDALCEMGLQLGADVPYCIRGGTMLAEGIGEELTALPGMPPCYVVLVKPPFSVSTAAVYARMNGGNLPLHPDTAGMVEALGAGDFQGICHRLFNVMEAVTSSRHPEIEQIKEMLLAAGACGAVMSGSGPTTFGLFDKKEQAEAAYQTLQKKYRDTFLCDMID